MHILASYLALQIIWFNPAMYSLLCLPPYSMHTYLLYVPVQLAVSKQSSKCPIVFYTHLASFSNIRPILY